MWMGGAPPLGYQPDGRSLAIVDEHAAIIRTIFRTYLDLGNVRLLQDRLELDGVVKPVRLTKAGRSYGGELFSRGELYTILHNPIYIGRIRHKDTSYEGLHQAIIAQTTWDAAQAQLTKNGRGTRSNPRVRHPSILAGKLFDDWGEPLIAVYANKSRVRYRYYVSRSLQHGGDARKTGGMRLPAREIEALVVGQIARIIDDPVALPGACSCPATATSQDMPTIITKARELTALLHKGRGGLVQALLSDIVERIDLLPDEVRVRMDAAGLGRHLGTTLDAESPALRITTPATLKRTGLDMRMVLESGEAVNRRQPDVRLIAAIVKARRWWGRLLEEPDLTITDLACTESLAPSYVTRIIRLAFLDPKIVTRITEGRTPADLNLERLTRTNAIPASWREQRQQLGFRTRRTAG